MAPVSEYVNIVTMLVRGVDEYYYHKPVNIANIFEESKTLHDLYIETLATFCTGKNEEGMNNFYAAGQGSYGLVGIRTFWFFGIEENQKISFYFTYGHQSETYLASMEVITENELRRTKRMVGGIVNCPVDVEIIDNRGTIVGEIKDNSIIKNDGGLALEIDGDSKSFLIPTEADYKIKLIGNDDGYMDYSLTEYDCDTLAGTRVLYSNVPLSDGKEYVDDLSVGTSIYDYQLKDSDGNNISQMIISEEDTGKLQVSVSVEGNGYADSLSNLTPGDYVTIEAFPKVGEQFLGWYENDTLLSNEAQYSFSIDDSKSFVAKFTANSSTNEEETSGQGTTQDQGTTPNRDTIPDDSSKAAKTTKQRKIWINYNKLTLGKGGKYQLSAYEEFNTDTYKTVDLTSNDIKWECSDNNVATVSSSGLVTAKNIGKCDIKITTLDGTSTATCSLTVQKPIKLKKVKLDHKNLSLKPKMKYELEVTLKPFNATIKSTKFKSSDKKIATVSKKGVVKAKKKGTCTITVTVKDKTGKTKTAKCKVTVK